MVLSFRIELTLQQASCGIVSRQLENINNAATNVGILTCMLSSAFLTTCACWGLRKALLLCSRTLAEICLQLYLSREDHMTRGDIEASIATSQA